MGVKIPILSLAIFAGMSEFGGDLKESIFFNVFYFSMCYVTDAEGIVFIFIMPFN